MNPLIEEAVASVRLGWVLGIMTLVFLSCFAAWVWWVYRPSNRRRMDDAARLPFSDGDES